MKRRKPIRAPAALSCACSNGVAPMSKQRLNEMLPFFSVLLLVATLFGLVLLKMEVRRMGYSVLKASQEYRKLKDHQRMMTMDYAKLTRPDLIRQYALTH